MTVEYKLVRFSGDKELAGKSTAIIEWVSKYGYNEELYKEVLVDITNIRLEGVTRIESEYIGSLDRWIMTIHTVSSNVIATVDQLQKKVVLVTENDNILTLFRVVEYLLNLGYDKDIRYRAGRVFYCVLNTFKKKCIGG